MKHRILSQFSRLLLFALMGILLICAQGMAGIGQNKLQEQEQDLGQIIHLMAQLSNATQGSETITGEHADNATSPQNPVQDDQILVQPEASPPQEMTAEEKLMQAIATGDLEQTEILLLRGADPNYISETLQLTPLMQADSIPMVKLLLEQGADPNKSDQDGAAALQYLMFRPSGPDYVRILLNKGADPNHRARGWNDETPLLTARHLFLDGKDGYIGEEIVTLLVEQGADINAQDKRGYTLLMTGAINRKENLIRLMLKLGADKDVSSHEGKSAREYAQELGYLDIVEMLK